jgi:hypothetical protein
MARGEWIVRMDAHSFFPPDYIAHGVARVQHGDVASATGPALASGNGRLSGRIALALRSRMGRGGAQFRHLSPDEIELDSGYCGVWRRSLLVAHGGWNEELSFTEDLELAARIGRAGGRIVCLPDMAATYLPRETLPGLATQYWRYGYHRVRTARWHPQMLRRSHVLPPLAVLTVLAGLAGPGRAGRAARQALALYAAALAVESARIAKDERARDAAGLPVVWGTMHLAWGSGFLAGCVSHGPPLAALATALRRTLSTEPPADGNGAPSWLRDARPGAAAEPARAHSPRG